MSIRRIPIDCSSPPSVIRTGQTTSGEFFARRMAESHSRRCCTRMSTPARTTCASIPMIRIPSTRRSGSNSRASSRAIRSAAHRVGSSSRPMEEAAGNSSRPDFLQCCRRILRSLRRTRRCSTPCSLERRAPTRRRAANRKYSPSISRSMRATTGLSPFTIRRQRARAHTTSPMADRFSALEAATSQRSRSIRRTRTWSTAHPSCSGAPKMAA